MTTSRYRYSTSTRFLMLGFVLWGVFALYIGSVTQTTLYDDPGIMRYLSSRSVINVFGMSEYVPGNITLNIGNYRPLSLVPWVLIRDWFGWFRPEMLHMVSIVTHVLCTALVASLAWRLGKAWKLNRQLLVILTSLFFGLFPLSYQSVLWAGAIGHPLMTMFGLLGVHAYLGYRTKEEPRLRYTLLLLCLIMLLASCLSHEQGFTFGLLILMIEALLAWRLHTRLNLTSIVVASVVFSYIVFYRFFISTFWTNPEEQVLSHDIGAIFTNVAYHAQGMIVWLLILLRNIIGLPANKELILIAMLVLNCLGLILLLWRMKLLALGLISLAWWGIAIAPSAFLLSNAYVLSGPRLMYAASVGIALLYAVVVAGLVARFRSRLLQTSLLAGVAVLCMWCVPYILDRSNEMDRLASALRNINTQLQTSSPSSKVLLINMPWWMGPTYPAFLIGSEGMLIFQEGSAPAWTLVASVGNTQRDTVDVHHPMSEKQGTHFIYGIAGPIVDDVALRAAIKESNYIFRFDYDSPGTRSEFLAQLSHELPSVAGVAHFSRNGASAVLEKAIASASDGTIHLELTWSDIQGFSEPVAIFVHGYDTRGQQVLIADRDLVDGSLPLNEVPQGMTVKEIRQMSIQPQETTIVQLQIGVYSRVTGDRYRALQADGSLWPGESVVIPVVTTQHLAKP